MSAPLLHRDRPALAVVVLCFGGLTAALTQTLVIPIQSELPELLDTSTTSLGAFEVPSEHAFRLCFVIGALAAFVGVAIVATIPRRRDGARSTETVAATGTARSAAVSEGAR